MIAKTSFIMTHLPQKIALGMLVFLTLNATTSAKLFPDVPANHNHFDAINEMSNREIIQGYDNGQFHPNGLINRAEAVKVMTNSKFLPFMIDAALDWHKQNGKTFASFPDVKIYEWYAKYIEMAHQSNIVHGYPDGFFRPGNNINFAEALKVILETYKVDFSQNNFQENKLLLVQKGEWFEKYFTYAYEHNLITRTKFYHPGQFITRGEFVEVIYRLETMLKNRWDEYEGKSTAQSNEYTITIPALGIMNVNVNPANVLDPNAALDVLKNGMGHYLNPPNIGRKTVMFGHSSGYSWDNSAYKTLLTQIDRLNEGDRIYVNYHEVGYVYQIYHKTIIPAAQDYMMIENEMANELVVFTCWPPKSIAQRYVVYAKPI